MSLIKSLVLLLVIVFSAHAGTPNKIRLSEDQLRTLNITYNTALEWKKRTGLSFERTVCGIQLAESSAGKEIIGDTFMDGKNVDLIDSSLGTMQTQPRTARWMITIDPYLNEKYGEFLYDPKYSDVDVYKEYKRLHKQVLYYTKIINNPKWSKGTSKKAKATLKWATRMLNQYTKEYNTYLPEIQKDKRLINKLLTDVKFGTEIALGYLSHYFVHDKKNPAITNHYFTCLSRYNGGKANYPYVNRVLVRMKLVDKLIKQGDITPYKKVNFLANLVI